MSSTNLQEKTAPHIVEIIDRLQKAGFESYIVGGAVRDFLLDRIPKDYDIATSATPEEVRKVFRDRHTIIIGRRFRLVHLIRGQEIIEISTFRKRPDEKLQADRPLRAADAPETMIFHDNEFGTSHEDAMRRDFTVNALFYDPVHDILQDFTGMGVQDIRDNVVRIIGEPELRFEEDPVRILRALKLVGQYGFHLEEKTLAALQSRMPLIVHASNSRMTLEMEKILKNPYGDRILRTFKEYGFLQYFLPWLDAACGTPQGEYALELLAKRNERMRRGEYRDSMSLAIAALALPFAERRIGGTAPGGLWEYQQGMESEFRSLILSVFRPLVITKRANIAAVRHLTLQTRFKEKVAIHRLRPLPSYPTARELAMIQNEVSWHIEDLAEACPPPEGGNGQPYRKRKHKYRHRNKAQQNAAPQSQQPSAPPPPVESGDAPLILGF